MKYKILNKTYALFSNYRNNWWANQNLKNVTMETEIISKTCFFTYFLITIEVIIKSKKLYLFSK